MAKYLIRGEKIDDCFIDVRDEEEAEYYVEETYNTDDGPMKLYKLVCVQEWP